MWEDARFHTPDGEFATELAVATDILFDPTGRPANPRPVLATLIHKESFEEPLNTTFTLCAAMVSGCSPGDEVSTRRTMADDLVTAALFDTWTVSDDTVLQVLPFVQTLAAHPHGERFTTYRHRDAAATPVPVVFPTASDADFLPMVLFVVGLSRLMAEICEAVMPGDPIRHAMAVTRIPPTGVE